jgi:RNA polymerase sigma-70 factor, ECF subfamily
MSDSLKITLERIREGDETAIGELVATHHLNLRGYIAAVSATVDSVDDLAQETFLRALQRLDRVETLEDFPRFLRGIARNVIREQSRKHASIQAYVCFVDELFEAEEKEVGCDSPFRDPGVLGALRSCVGRLSPKARQMLTFRYQDELRCDEIAQSLGMNAGAVRVSLLRVRETLLKCLRSTVGRQLSEAGL